MNSDQILVLVAALGVVTIAVSAAVGSKNKKPATTAGAHAALSRAKPRHGNRAQRRHSKT